ncbi:hypothetical protein TRFO_11183 [Tritrichomonas foetus]|uniref:Protein kinase domain-containing protein n=1 Tax=Tritrichomonas foetus TaxID=1144522 RepID=A0A1J4J4R6_9EUKA|nr:hypothetical protein TRFO_11183 [Tritrichomonas foetus]|eukprot:OHS94328.1 hypothetical protein TRFO_11183 [Tritrichomonas foetus]
MLSFPLSSKEVKTSYYFKVKEIKSNVVTLMKARKTAELFIFQNRNPDTNRQDFNKLLKSLYYVYHPSILRLEGFSNSNHKIIITKYMKNGSLAQICGSKENISKLTTTNRRIIIFGIATAFEYLHCNNLLMSPFDPSDVILSDEYQPLIQLCSICQKTKKSSKFLPPEYSAKETYSEKTDVFTLGAILFELATETNFESIQSLSSNVMNNITELASTTIRSCCAENPSSRPSFSSIVDSLMNSEDPLFEDEDISIIENYTSRNLEYQQMDKFKLSRRYKEGKDLPQDLEMAAFLMKECADKKKPRAMFSYGKMLLNGVGVKENQAEARKYLELAAENGYEKAKQQLINLDRREEFERPILIHDKLLNFKTANYSEIVNFIVNGNSETKDTAAHIIIDLLRIRPLNIPKLARLTCDICTRFKPFISYIIDYICINMDAFSLAFLYQIYKKKVVSNDNLISVCDNVENIDNSIILLSWLGPEIKEINPSVFDNLVSESDFQYDEKRLKQRRSEKHPKNKILQTILAGNPSEIKKFSQEDINFSVPKDYYDPISCKLSGQKVHDYAAFIGCYHVFKLFEFEDSPTIVKNAICGGSLEILNSLKASHADFTNSLKIALLYHQQAIFDWILRNGLDSLTGDLILYAATSNNSHFLLDYKCDPFITDSEGNSALHIAAKYGSVDFLRILIALYEDINLNEMNDNCETPMKIAQIKGHQNVIDLLTDALPVDQSCPPSPSPFDDYVSKTSALLDPIPNISKDISDDDFLELENEVNNEYSDEKPLNPSSESYVQEFDRNTFLTSSTTTSSKSLNIESKSKITGIHFSSDSENSSMIQSDPYLLTYLKGIMPQKLFEEVQKLQKNGTYFKTIEIPEGLNRPFQITNDFAELIIDVINELVDTDQLYNYTYDGYIQKLFSMFNNETDKFKEDSPQMIISQYHSMIDDNQMHLMFSISDKMLKKQVFSVLSIGEQPMSDLETTIIDSNFEDDRKRRNIPPPPPPASPLQPESVDSISEVFHDVDLGNDHDVAAEEEEEITLKTSQNISLFDEEVIKSDIKNILNETIFNDIKKYQSESIYFPFESEESSPMVLFVKKMVEMDYLPDFSYEEYINHLLQAYEDDHYGAGSNLISGEFGYSEGNDSDPLSTDDF